MNINTNIYQLGIQLEKLSLEAKDNKEFAWLDEEAKGDLEHIKSRKDNIITGFLSIGNKDGWKSEEGGSHETGYRFVRFMLRKFWSEKSSNLGEYSDIFRRTLKAFSPAEMGMGDKSEFPRCTVDRSITGWYRHSVARLVGNVCKEFRPNGPFFEVLVNSAKTSPTSDQCYPFRSAILSTSEVAVKRFEILKCFEKLPSQCAYPAFYSAKLESPDDFVAHYTDKHCKEPGPNSKRLLSALEELNHKKLKSQRIGNCWMKQNKRSVLVSLFIETVTHRPELSVSQAWKISNTLYKKWKVFAVNEVEQMLQSGGLPLDLEKLVKSKLHQ